MATTTNRTAPSAQRRQSSDSRSPIGGKVIDPVRILRQNVWAIFASAILGMVVGGIAFVVCLFFFPSYQGTVTFELFPELQAADSVVSSDRRTADTVTRLARTEAGRIKTQKVLTTALEDRDVRRTAWAEQFKEDEGSFDLNEALLELTDELNAYHVRDTNTFIIAWDGSTATDVPVILTAVQNSYMAALVDITDARYNSNLKTFTDQRKDLDAMIVFLETEKQNFVRENNITSLNEAVNERRGRIEELILQISETSSSVEVLNSRRQQLQAKITGRLEPSNDDIRIAEQDPIVMNIMSRIRDLRIELGTARERLHPNHLSVKSIERTLKASEDEKASAVQEIINRDLNARFKETSDETASFEQLLKSLELDYEEAQTNLRDYASALGELQSIDRRLDAANNDRDEINRTIADINQIRVREDASKVFVQQGATLPKELAFPDIKLMLPAGIALIVGLTLGLVFLRELLDNRVKYPSEISSIAGARLLGVVPDSADDPTGVESVELVVRNEPDSVMAESFRQTAAQVNKEMSAAGHKSLLLISGMPDAGTTTIANNLAGSLAATGRKVVVVDANFRRPRVEESFGIATATRGLGDALAAEAPVDSVVITTPDSIDLIGAGSEINRVFERLNTSAMDDLLDTLKRRYDYVLIDGPPGVVSGDALVLASKCDATTLIVRAGSEERGLIGRLINQLRQMEASFIGVIFNRPRHTAGGYFKKNFQTMASYSPKHDSVRSES